VSKQAVVV